MSHVQPIRILITAGGTGGHIYPGLAVAEQLQQDGVEVQWLGSANSMEAKLVPEHNLPFHAITVKGVRGKGILTKLTAPWMLFKALVQARKIVRLTQADCVLGMGGFAAGPGCLAAKLAGKAVVIHEQNAVAGMTNRSLSKIANKVLLGFPNAIKNKHSEWVGNPVRAAMTTMPAPAQRINQTDTLRLLVVGGSLGASTLNQVVPESIALLQQQLGQKANIKIIHQTGQRTYDDCMQAYRQHLGDTQQLATVQAYIDDMALAYSQADLVLCRAGALTVAEVSNVGMAAILVPYPYAVDDHQASNSAQLVEAGAAIMVRDDALTAQWLCAQLQHFIAHPQELLSMAERALTVAKPDASQRIAAHCMALAEQTQTARRVA